jgi:hypothetical protein
MQLCLVQEKGRAYALPFLKAFSEQGKALSELSLIDNMRCQLKKPLVAQPGGFAPRGMYST